MSNLSSNFTVAYTAEYQLPTFWHIISSVLLFIVIPLYLHLMLLAAQRQTLIAPSLLHDRSLKEPWMYGEYQSHPDSRIDNEREATVGLLEMFSRRAWIEVAKQRKPYAFWIAYATVWTNISMIGSNLTGFGCIPYTLGSWPYHVSLFFADCVCCHFLQLLLTIQFSSLKLNKMNIKKTQNPDEYKRLQQKSRLAFHCCVGVTYTFYFVLYVYHVTKIKPRRIEVYEAFVTGAFPNILFCHVLCILEAWRLIQFARGIQKTFKQVGAAPTENSLAPVSTNGKQQLKSSENAERKLPSLKRQGTRLAFKAVRRPLQVAFSALVLVSFLEYFVLSTKIRQPSEFIPISILLFIIGHAASVIAQMFYLRLWKQVLSNRRKALKKMNRAFHSGTVASSSGRSTIVTIQCSEGDNQRKKLEEIKVKTTDVAKDQGGTATRRTQAWE